MELALLHSIFYSQLRSGKEIEISVIGVSMEPTLREGDSVTIRSCESYAVGDILVFLYKNNELLIHRLLRIDGERYFCKGDNAFRLEDVPREQIAGKVIKKNGGVIPSFTEAQSSLSYLVNRVFRQNSYQTEQTQKSGIYRFYMQHINKVEDITLTYQKNINMDYISLDKTSLAVVDSDSGDTLFFDETGVDILNALDNAITLECLLEKLCEIYDVKPHDIRTDVEEFLAECISKKVVIVE